MRLRSKTIVGLFFVCVRGSRYNGVGVNRGRGEQAQAGVGFGAQRNKNAHNFILQLPVKRASIRTGPLSFCSNEFHKILPVDHYF